MFKMIVFDLDGTLAPSKGQMDDEMIGLFKALLSRYRVGVISGGDYPQFQKQIIPFMGNDAMLLENLYICPTCSTKMYVYRDSAWQKLYSLDFTREERENIIRVLDKAIIDLGLLPEQTWGDLIEDRETQITYSALGQQAPLEAKHAWDPDFEKRKNIREHIRYDLQDFNILVGGATSIDITRAWVDKAYGIRKLMEISGLGLNDIIFVGDAVFPGWNDYPPLDIGVTTKKVFCVEDTKEYIRSLIR